MSISKNTEMVSPVCLGRTKIMQQDRKWYIDKKKSSMLYTCCEGCFNNYIKGTDKESEYHEINTSNGGTNCDFLLYKTECDFQDCSITKNNIRVSCIDNAGNRYKLDSKSLEPTFLVQKNDTYSLLIENLTDDLLKESSMISLEKCKINNNLFEIMKEDNFMPFIVETEIIPQLHSETDHNISNTDDDIIFTVLRYSQFTMVNVSGLTEISDDHLNEYMYPVQSNTKYKGFLGMCIYKCDPSNIIDFSITIKRIDHLSEIQNDNMDGTFNIAI